RDTVWAEDLGKLPRRFGFQCFLTGDDVYQTRDRMIRACEQAGAGTLVHPTMGSIQVVCIDFDVIDRRDRGRYVEVTLAFVAAGDVLYPATIVATGQAVATKADAVMPAAIADLKTSIAALPVLPTVRSAVDAVQQYSGMAISAVNDATRAFNSVRGLAGYFGRYASGSRGTIQTGTVQSAISAAITTRSAVLTAANSLISIASRLWTTTQSDDGRTQWDNGLSSWDQPDTPAIAHEEAVAWADQYAAAAAALADALLASANDPADAIRLLLPLTAWIPAPFPGDGALSQAATDAQDIAIATLRCAACAALGRAAQAYQPISYQDALATRQAVCGALDAEATRAADAGRDASYQALRELRAAVALDLAVRGANLAWLVDVTTAQTEPSLAEAWGLYQDTTREPGMVGSAEPPHPLFMPLDFPTLPFCSSTPRPAPFPAERQRAPTTL